MSTLRPSRTIIVPPTVSGGESRAPQLTPGLIQGFMRARGVHEDILVHAQNYKDFLREKGVTELGRGGEGAVYFLRGHVVKLTGVDFTPGLLREIVHMLHLNPISGPADGAAMGERQRTDLPGLLWVYTLSNGGLSVGMKPFDTSDHGPRGSTLYDRLFGGPPMDREHILRALLAIAKTLVYTQKKGIVHHDLKPANIYIPGNPSQDPVVFDLGQALWKQNVWGANWLTNGHNLHYWYNGTYQYMHRARRAAHMCALKIAGGGSPSESLRNAFYRFVPSMYDDVFPFAYIVRDAVRSKFTKLREIDKRLLTDYYKSLMGIYKARITQPTEKKKTIIARVKTLFAHDNLQPLPLTNPQHEPLDTMEHAYSKLQPVMANLLGIK